MEKPAEKSGPGIPRTEEEDSRNHFSRFGLTTSQVQESARRFGNNSLNYKKESGLLAALLSLAKEPMVILLLAASLIYFIKGSAADGIFMVSAIGIVSAIALYQDSRSRNAVEKLRELTQPYCRVVRNGEIQSIRSDELVIGDALVADEGISIAADGTIVHSNDFSVNESLLTGESLPVFKDAEKDDNMVYRGTTVTSGLAIAIVSAIGNETRLGKIGVSLEDIKAEKTPLERQINNFVIKMAIAGAAVFLVVWGINFFHSYNVADSLLKALTLAMSILPEEIPVAFTTFMALGAWRMMKAGILVKQIKTVETLGSATVICTDKTGTITENKMSLARLFVAATEKITDPGDAPAEDEKELISTAMWASEPIPFDPMETALHDAYGHVSAKDERPRFSMVHEYPLSGKPPMMTHIFENQDGKRIIAAKGAPEAFFDIADMSPQKKQAVAAAIKTLAADGYRLLGVADAEFDGDDFPPAQQDFKFRFKGLVAFYDPPKKNIQAVFDAFYRAGIAVKIITGDNDVTTAAIARQIAFKGYDLSLTGDEVMKRTDRELNETVQKINIFTRMFPEAKLRVINALKARHEIVAMTGDGINDGPALKAAHIGIAMGKKGTEIARQAASLILLEDDLAKMVDAVAMGRRIYTNIKKAIQYVISIHIPIILTVFLPLALGWVYPNIFSPVHIIYFELIMGPTCSVIYENEPAEKNTMLRKPRPFTKTFFSWRELTTSIIQGLAITAGSLGIYQYCVLHGYSEPVTRTMVFTALVSANLFLTLVNRSFYYSCWHTLRYKNRMVSFIIMVTVALTILLLSVPVLARFFDFEVISLPSLLLAAATGFVSVIWYEVVKWVKRLYPPSEVKESPEPA